MSASPPPISQFAAEYREAVARLQRFPSTSEITFQSENLKGTLKTISVKLSSNEQLVQVIGKQIARLKKKDKDGAMSSHMENLKAAEEYELSNLRATRASKENVKKQIAKLKDMKRKRENQEIMLDRIISDILHNFPSSPLDAENQVYFEQSQNLFHQVEKEFMAAKLALDPLERGAKDMRVALDYLKFIRDGMSADPDNRPVPVDGPAFADYQRYIHRATKRVTTAVANLKESVVALPNSIALFLTLEQISQLQHLRWDQILPLDSTLVKINITRAYPVLSFDLTNLKQIVDRFESFTEDRRKEAKRLRNEVNVLAEKIRSVRIRAVDSILGIAPTNTQTKLGNYLSADRTPSNSSSILSLFGNMDLNDNPMRPDSAGKESSLPRTARPLSFASSAGDASRDTPPLEPKSPKLTGRPTHSRTASEPKSPKQYNRAQHSRVPSEVSTTFTDEFDDFLSDPFRLNSSRKNSRSGMKRDEITEYLSSALDTELFSPIPEVARIPSLVSSNGDNHNHRPPSLVSSDDESTVFPPHLLQAKDTPPPEASSSSNEVTREEGVYYAVPRKRIVSGTTPPRSTTPTMSAKTPPSRTVTPFNRTPPSSRRGTPTGFSQEHVLQIIENAKLRQEQHLMNLQHQAQLNATQDAQIRPVSIGSVSTDFTLSARNSGRSSAGHSHVLPKYEA